MLRIGWFSSGRGQGSWALLRAVCEAIRAGGLPVEIAYVFCNRERGEHEPADQFLDLADSYRLPVVTLSSTSFRRRVGGEIARLGQPLPPWRRDYDDAVLRLVEPFGSGVAVLAGYMLIAPELCRRLTLLNLHPAAPNGPAGIWQEVIWQLIEQRAGRSGVTIFRATPELDAGPPLTYCTYALDVPALQPTWQAIEGRSVAALRAAEGETLPLFAAIRQRGAVREPPLLIQTLAALAGGRLQIATPETKTAPLNLTREVDQALGPDV